MCVRRRFVIAGMVMAVAVVAHLFMHVDITADAVTEADGVEQHVHAPRAGDAESRAAGAGGEHASHTSHELVSVWCMAVLGTVWVAVKLATRTRPITGLERRVRSWGDGLVDALFSIGGTDRIDAGVVLLV